MSGVRSKNYPLQAENLMRNPPEADQYQRCAAAFVVAAYLVYASLLRICTP